jgi:predicted transcriptional regulator
MAERKMARRINLVLHEDLYSRLSEAAWTTRVSMSEYMRQAVCQMLDRRENKDTTD